MAENLPVTQEQRLAELPDQRVAAGITSLAQKGIREGMASLTDRQRDWLKMRAMTATDAHARHISGHTRDNSGVLPLDTPCGCGKKEVGWVDMPEKTVLLWKKEDGFRPVYDALLAEPVLFAGAQLQALAPKAVQAYDELLEPDMKPAIRRLAAKDVLEADGLKATIGVQGSGDGVSDNYAFRLALSRYERNLELSDEQRRLLKESGVEIDDSVLEARLLSARAGTERTLDGDDVPVRGGDNTEFLPD